MSNEDTKRADALVMFGLTGDLGSKKLFPAIAELARADMIDGPVIGVGRQEVTTDELWSQFSDAVDDLDDELRDSLDLRYVSGDSEDSETYVAIVEELGDASLPVVYAAIPPHLFESVADGVGEALPSATRLVLEKPFGDDADSASALYRRVTRSVDADRLFIVDHFLAKSAVENLTAFRHANPMIEAALRSGPVKRIEITMAEEFGVDGRGGFYEGVGAVKDVLQSHLLQTVAALLMDPTDPEDSPEASRAELLSSIRPIDPTAAVYGQYDGYTDLDDVDPQSTTETFVAVHLEIDTDRWRGVDVLVRTGKQMHDTYTEAVVVFSDDEDVDGAPGNTLRFQLKPTSTIAMEVAVLDPVDHGFQSSTFWGCAPTDHVALGDYATMLEGAIVGDRQHFASIEGVVAAWHVVEPLVDRPPRIHRYESGSVGPTEASDLTAGRPWLEGPLTPER